ncbi:MAG TPA: transcription factor TFIIIC [Pyrodictium sp.]|nr:transcription factor TFIIIC [Pyrodictium sp.]
MLTESQSGSKLSELESKALEVIKSRGEQGIYQHELWKLLGIDSREGSRLAIRLLKKGLIVREPVVHEGRRTYKLMLAKPATTTLKVEVNLDFVVTIPCFTCPNLERCHPGGFYDPVNCPKLNQWLDSLLQSSTNGNGGINVAKTISASPSSPSKTKQKT